MANLLKKYWFVVIVAFILIGAFSYVTYEDNKDKVPGKKYQGQDVVFSIGDLNVTADMLYEKMNNEHTEELNYFLLERMQVLVLNQSLPITKEMREEAAQAVETMIIPYYRQNYGDYYQYQLQGWMNSIGYSNISELTDYSLAWLIVRPKLTQELIKTNLDKYYLPYVEEQHPRIIHHILVLMEDSDEPTEEELAKVAAIEEALKTRDFNDVAEEFSDDTYSAAQKGRIGIVDEDNRDGYVEEFSDSAMTLADGQTSEWVKTVYGWHLIKNVGSQRELLEQDDELYNRLTALNPDFAKTMLYDKAMELGLDFMGNDVLKKYILENMGVEEE